MLKRIDAILWRRCNKATFDTLNSASRGQYDIRLAKRDYEVFFHGVPQSSPTSLGGYTLHVELEAFDGPSPVAATTIDVRFLGPASDRKDWNISSQRLDTAYPLWRMGRGMHAPFIDNANEYVLVVRDVDGKFHGRWIKHKDFAALPAKIQTILRSAEAGWKEVS